MVKQLKNTHIRIILDETGSMFPTKKETIGTFNSYIDDLKKDKKLAKQTFITLTQFNSYKGAKIENNRTPLLEFGVMEDKDYTPTGYTPLYDAIGLTISEGGKEPTIVVIITDGEENASRQYTLQTVKQLIETRQGDGWTFIFLGADLSRAETVKVATNLGLYAQNTMSFDKSQIQAASQTLSNVTQSLRGGYASGIIGQSVTDVFKDDELDIRTK